MKLIIDVSEKPVLKLVKNGKVIARTQWDDASAPLSTSASAPLSTGASAASAGNPKFRRADLDILILGKIGALLRKNKIKIGEIKKIETVVDEQKFTTARIARSVAEALRLALSEKR